MSKKIIYFVVCFFIFIFSFNVVTFALGEPSLPGGFFSESHEKIFTLVDHQMGLGGGGKMYREFHLGGMKKFWRWKW